MTDERQTTITFTVDCDSLSDLTLKSMREVIRMAKRAHWTDIHMRINGQDRHFQADWIKYLQEVQNVA